MTPAEPAEPANASADPAIGQLVDTAPPLTPELVDRLRSLLPPPADDSDPNENA